MKIFSDERLLGLGVISGTVSRHTGSGREAQNVKKFFDTLDIDSANILGLRQVHGAHIVPIISGEDLKNYRKTAMHEGDAWLLGRAGCGCMILTADCAPLYVWNDRGICVGLAHCGWRGVAAGLPRKIAEDIKIRAGKNVRLCAYIGPHINACCFEVREDAAGQFGQRALVKKGGKIFVDLAAEITAQLLSAGADAKDIRRECACNCTMCNKEDFFSYRRDKTRDTMISFIYKPA
ncbi:MAG: polyphenol oxidase family protein [Elusimicrobiota bacterium]|jgi:YfiH family protein|nr:polyphenol oxidase family protein [Elusimicrobiota bacterium]